LKIGDSAPDFNLVSDEGKKVSFKDFLGRKVVSISTQGWNLRMHPGSKGVQQTV